MTTEKMLKLELKNEIENLKNLTPGTREHSEAVSSIIKIQEQLSAQKDRTLDRVVNVGEAAGKLAFMASFMILGFSFENGGGAFMSDTFKYLTSNFKSMIKLK